LKLQTSLIIDGFNLGLIFGALLGITLPFLLLVGLHFKHLQDWQELIGGILALFGAAGAVFAVIKQIAHTQEIEDDRRHRQMYAARAMMPHALTSLCDYAECCCKELRDIIRDAHLPDNHQALLIPETFRFPAIPTTSMEPLNQLLQFGDREIQNAIAALMQYLQVQQSRGSIRSIEPNQIFAYQYYSRIAEALEVYARTSALFAYARGTTESVAATPTKEQMRSAANSCGFWHDKWNKLENHIKEHWRPYSPIPDQPISSN
jgi:hypothetical protein